MSWKSISRRIKKAARGERAVKAKENTAKKNGSKSASTDGVIAKKNNGTLPAELEAELDKVREAAPPPSDDPIYKYLRRVYGLRCELADKPEWEDALRHFRQAHHPRISTRYIRLIIELTANDHVTSKMKHKYFAVLHYAFEKGIKPKDLEAFIKKQDGINKCVELWSETYGPAAVKKQAKKKAAK